jgi:hypothetical protein
MQKNVKNAWTKTQKKQELHYSRESGTEHAQNTSTLGGSPCQK